MLPTLRASWGRIISSKQKTKDLMRAGGLMRNSGMIAATAAAMFTCLSPARAEPVNWTGPWFGIATGARMETGRFTRRALFGIPLRIEDFTDKSSATRPVLALSAGYDMRFGRLVAGAFAGMDFSTSQLAGNMPYLGLRAGVLLDERILVYAIGGLQSMQHATQGSAWVSFGTLFPLGAERIDFMAKAGRRWGPFVGAGIEYRLTSNWSVNADYTYARTTGRFAFDLDGRSRELVPSLDNKTTEVSTHTFRLGLKYRL